MAALLAYSVTNSFFLSCNGCNIYCNRRCMSYVKLPHSGFLLSLCHEIRRLLRSVHLPDLSFLNKGSDQPGRSQRQLLPHMLLQIFPSVLPYICTSFLSVLSVVFIVTPAHDRFNGSIQIPGEMYDKKRPYTVSCIKSLLNSYSVSW